MTTTDHLSGLVRTVSGGAEVNDFGRVETVLARVLVLARCVLAASALAIVLVDPSKFGRMVWLAYTSLGIYSVYTVFLAIASYRLGWPVPPRLLHWADVAFYAFLLSQADVVHTMFFLFFFYPIVVASFLWGLREGLLVTVICCALFVTIGLIIAPHTGTVTGYTLIAAAYLLVFGYIISWLGGYERLMWRRLGLLREINNLWSPRFGVDYVHGKNLDRLLEFYDGTLCALVLRRPSPALNYAMYSAARGKLGQSATPATVTESVAGALLSLPDSLGAFYHDPAGSWRHRFLGYFAYDFDLRVATDAFRQDCAAFANLLDTQAFVTVPYAQRNGTSGRIFLTNPRPGFSRADIEFLAQVSEAMSTVVENMSMVEELVTKATDHERQNISRDLHDTTIQPYIGLKLALDALHREAGEDNALAPRITELIHMTELTVRDLRQYASALKDKSAVVGEFLVAAVQKQSEQFGRFYGINVEVKSDVSPGLGGQLAGDAFKIISEGLSNVLRHTPAKKAFVSILCENSNLLLQIGNEAGQEPGVKPRFIPRSIQERAQSLGGKTFVEQRQDGHTIVHVTLPM
jgi:signal transduction histidine kinase